MKEKMQRVAMLMLVAVVFAGCISSTPERNSNFGIIDELKMLNGEYQNRGEGAEGVAPTYLSSLVWPSATNIDHSSITTIAVQATGKNSLLIRAYSADVLVKQDLFVLGKDFTLRSGKIRLRQGLYLAGLHVGDPLIGPYYHRDELGLDQTGHGKYRTQGALAGLVYAVLPIALFGKEEVRFVRIRNE